MEIPALAGNWVDLLVIFIIFLYLWSGWKRGFFLGILDLGGFIFSFFIALKTYSRFGVFLIVNFSLPKGIANALGFLLAGLLIELILSFIISFFARRLYLRIINYNKHRLILKFDRLLGFIPASGEAVIFTAFILTLIISLPIQGAIKNQIVSSKLGGALVAKTQGVERELNSIFGEAVNETLTFFTINPNLSSTERVDLGFQQREVSFDESAEATMFLLVNQERQKNGLKPLTFSLSLRELARNYGKDMFARGFFSHYDPEGLSPFDRMNKAKILFAIGGENLALAPNVFLAHQGLMNSPGHRANILLPDFNKIGIGVIDGGIYGQMYVQEFTD